MSEGLIFEGKKYIPARVAAKLAGYTSDYVGQLCRGGKVLSRMVGRSWFVSEESILEHKAQNHLSQSASKVFKILETESVQATNSTGDTVTSVTEKTVALEYVPDATPLIPELRRVNTFSSAVPVAPVVEKVIEPVVEEISAPASITKASASRVSPFRIFSIDRVLVRKVGTLALAATIAFGSFAFAQTDYPKAIATAASKTFSNVAQVLSSPDSLKTAVFGGDESVLAYAKKGASLVSQNISDATVGSAVLARAAVSLPMKFIAAATAQVSRLTSVAAVGSQNIAAATLSSISTGAKESLETLAVAVNTEVNNLFRRASGTLASFFTKKPAEMVAVVPVKTETPAVTPVAVVATTTPIAVVPVVTSIAPVKQVVIEGPRTIVQKVTERILVGDISRAEVEEKLNALNNALGSKILSISAATGANATYINNVYNNAVAPMNKIDELTRVRLEEPTVIGGTFSNPSITGGTLSGVSISNSSFSGSTGTFTGDLTIAGTVTSYSLFQAPYFVATSTTATSTFAGDLAVDGSTLYVDSINNRVGFGTTTPGTILSIADTANFAPDGTSIFSSVRLPFIVATSTTATSTFAGFVDIRENLVVGGFSSASYFNATNTGATSTFAGGFNAGGALGLNVFQNGVVSIGTTSTNSSAAFVLRQRTNGDTMFLGIRNTDIAPAGDFITYRDAAGTALFRVDNSGNLLAGGIINSGSQTITSTSQPQLRTQYDASNEMTFSTNSTGLSTIAVNGTTPMLRFAPQTDSATAFNFTNSVGDSIFNVDTANRRIGIGTTSPYAALSVAGTIVGQNFIATSSSATSTFAGGVRLATEGGNVGIGVTTPQYRFQVGGRTGAFDGGDGAFIENSGAGQRDVLTLSTVRATGVAGANNDEPQIRFMSGISDDGSGTPYLIGAFGILAENSADSVRDGAIVFRPGDNETLNERMRITSAGNVGIGTTSPYAKLSVVGEIVGAKFTATSTTASSTFNGAINVATSAANGAGVILSNGSRYIHNYGTNNFFAGVNAGNLTLVTGTAGASSNTGVGVGALASVIGSGSNSEGQSNAAFGYTALTANTLGTNNTAMGRESLMANLTGNDNAALGLAVLYQNTTGSFNTGAGRAAGGNNTTGSLNTFLGYQADTASASQSGLTYATAVGANARVAISSALVLGGTGTAKVSVGIGTTSPYATLSVTSGDTATTTFALRPVASQTANIFDLYNTSGALTSVITAGGNWGIGTTSPYSRLSVAGVVTADSFNATNTAATSTFSGGALFATGGGNVGVGTTSPFAPLSVSGANAGARAIAVLAQTGRTGYLQFANGTNGATAFQPRILGAEQANPGSTFALELVGQSDSDNASDLPAIMLDGRATSSALSNRPLFGVGSFFSSITNLKFIIGANGNVGIGTSSPYTRLSVAGVVTADSFNATNTAATSTFAGGFSAASSLYALQNGNVGIGTASPGKMLQVNGTTRLNWPSSGTPAFDNSGVQIGVNATNQGTTYFTADQTYTVNFADLLTSSGRVANISYDGTNNRLVMGVDRASSQILLYTAGTERVRIDASGNFGIGTSTPNSRLQIAATAPSLFLSDLAAGVDGKHWFINSNNGLFSIGTTSDSLNATSTYFAINNRGFVGIGTTSPSQNLGVQGNGYISGSLFVGGAITSTSTFTLAGISPNSVLTTDASGNVVGSSTPSVANIFATSTTATSTFAGGARFASGGGNVLIGTSTAATGLLTIKGGNISSSSYSLSVLDSNDIPALRVSNGHISTFGTLGGRNGVIIGDGTEIGIVKLHSTAGTYTARLNSFEFVLPSDGALRFNSASALTTDVQDVGISRNAAGILQLTNGVSSLGTAFIIPTVYGSASASGSLTLESTSHSTKGSVVLAPTTGNVGIGTTSPYAKLSIQGSGAFSGDIAGANMTATGTLSVTGTITSASTITGTRFVASSASATSTFAGGAAFATGGGNVGIGTTTPSARLHSVVNSATAVSLILDTYTGSTESNANEIRFRTALGTPEVPGASGTSPLGALKFYHFSTGSVFNEGARILATPDVNGRGGNLGFYTATNVSAVTERMRIGTNGGISFGSSYVGTDPGSGSVILSGSLGVGSTSLSSHLSVQGNGYISGNLFVGGAITSTSTFTLAGISPNSILTTNASGVVVGSSTPTAANFLATSTTATSTFAGGALFATGGGNVGIGTTSPDTMLHLSQTTGPVVRLERNDVSFDDGDVIGGTEFYTNDASINSTGLAGAIRYTGGSNWSSIGWIGRLGLFTTGASGPTAALVERMSIDNNGNVGIGSTSPYARLSVAGIVVADSFNATNTAATSTFAGVVGIGTTTPVMKLHIAGNEDVFGQAGMEFEGLSSNSGSRNWVIGNGLDNYGAFDFSVGSAKGATPTSVGIKMSILSSGNVGIGTTSPYARLSVAGPVVADSFNATNTAATTTIAGGLNVGNGAITYDYSSGTTNIDNLTLGSFNLDTDAGIVSWIDMPVTANASIGTVESYTAQLDGNPMLSIYGESDGAGGTQNRRVGIASTTPWATFSINPDGIGSNPEFAIGSSTALHVIVTNTGKFGLGTSTPTELLSVQGNSYISGNLFVGGNITSTSSTFTLAGISPNSILTTNASGVVVGSSTPTAANFLATSTTATSTFAGGVRLATSAGNVGIGTTSPWAKLSVTGGSGTGAPGIALKGTNSGGAFMSFEHSSQTTSWIVGQGLHAQGDFVIRDNNAGSRLVIDSSGRIGFASSTPTHSLEISGTSPNIWLGSTGTFSGQAPFIGFQGANANQISLGYRDATGNFVIGSGQDITSGEQLVITRTTGNVGIGTTSPSAKLSITGTGATTGRLLALSDSNNVEKIGALDNGKMIIGTSTAGLGSTAPQLTIEGTPQATYSQGVTINLDVRDTSTFTTGVGGGIGFSGQYRAPASGVDYALWGAIKGLKTTSGTSNAQGQLAFYTSSPLSSNPLLEAMRIDQNQRVGISTTTPWAMLSVSATSSLSNLPVFVVSAVPSAGATTTALIVASTGNVGIGTTSPLSKLTVSGITGGNNMTLENTSSTITAGDVVGSMTFYTGDVSGITDRNTARISSVAEDTFAGDDAGSGLAFSTHTGVAGTLTEKLRITKSGNVGIGTTTPGALLTAYSGATVSSTGQEVARFAAQTTSGTVGSGPFVTFANANNIILGKIHTPIITSNQVDMAFSSINSGGTLTETLRLANGNVGIGTTTPAFPLDIYGTGDVIMRIDSNSAGGDVGIRFKNNDRTWLLYNDAPNEDFNLRDITAGTVALTVQASTGYLGVGSSTPGTARITAQGAAGVPSLLIANSSAADYAYMAYQGTGRTYTMGVGNASETALGVANKFFLYDSGASAARMVVDTSGNVGIGTTSPWARLSVSATSTLSNVPLFAVSTVPSAAATTTAFVINSDGKLGIGGLATTTDGMVTVNASSALDWSNVLTLNQFNDSNEDSSVLALVNRVNSGTRTANLQTILGQNIDIAPTFTLTDTANAVVIGSTNTLDLSGMTVGESSSGTSLGVTGGKIAITGAPSFTNTSAPNSISTVFGMDVSITGSSTVAAGMADLAFLEYIGANVSVTPTATDERIETSATGVSVSVGGSANGNKKAGYFSVQGSGNLNTGVEIFGIGHASTNYLLHLNNLAAGANNYAIYSDAPAQSYFAGFVGVGTTTPWAKLSIDTNSLGSAPAFVISSSTQTSFVVTNGGKFGIGGQATTTDGMVEITSSSALDWSRVLNINQLNDSAEDSTALSIMSSVNAGTVTGTRTISGQTLHLAPTLSLLTNGTANIDGSAHTVDLSGITIGDTASPNLITSGSKIRLTGAPTYTGTLGASPQAVVYGVDVGITGSSTIAASMADIGDLNYFGGNFSLSLTGQDERVVTSAYGVQSVVSGSLNGNKYGGSFSASGPSFVSYGLFVSAGGGTTGNYGLYLDVTAAAENYSIYSYAAAKSYFNGSIGMGTTTPWGRISIDTAGLGAAEPALAIGSISGGTDFVVAKGGNVGIGTSTPYAKLSVAGEVVGRNFTATSTNATSTFAGGIAGPGSFTVQQGNGNVGIGTTSPSALLNVNGNANIDGVLRLRVAADDLNASRGIEIQPSIFSGTQYIRGYGATSGGGLQLQGYHTGAGLVTSQLFVDPTNGLIMSTNNGAAVIERMRITTAGAVGISTTSPWAMLSVSATSTLSNLPVFAVSATPSAGATTTALIIASTGNVGIGTTSPASKLTVSGTSAEIALNDTSGNTAVIKLVAGSSSGVIQGFASGTQVIQIHSASNQATYFNTGANFGIGTTSPYTRLSVAGVVVADSFNATNTAATSTIAGGFNVGSGALTYDYSSGITSIDNLQIGAYNFETNAGVLSWVDLPVTSAATIGTKESYTAQINGNPLLTVYAESDGANGIQNPAVGIGTTSPYAALSVVGASGVVAGKYTATSTTATSTFAGFIDVLGTGTNATSTFSSNLWVKGNLRATVSYVGDLVFSNDFRFVEAHASATPQALFLKNQYNEDIFGIDEDGNMGLGTTTTAGYKLQVAGDVAATSFVNISTRTAKTDISYLGDSDKVGILNKIKNIQVANYRYISEPNTDPLRLGLIAEEAPTEVLAVGGKGVDIYKLSTFLLAGVQEQQKQIESISARVATLEQLFAGNGGGAGFSFAGVLSSLEAFGVKIENGIAYMKNLVTESLTVGSSQAAAGITLFDTVTKQPYCLTIENGATKSTAGTCESIGAGGSTATSTPAVSGDTVPPVLTVIGANPAEITKNSAYVDLGASVVDPAYGTTPANTNLGVHTTGSVDTNVLGTYTLYYSAQDQAGNAATTTRTVVVYDPAIGTSTPPQGTSGDVGTTTPATADTTPPVITANGSLLMELTVGDAFTDPGVTALDDVDGDITSRVSAVSTVNTTVAGGYKVTYSVSDTAGNSSEVERTVTVVSAVGDTATSTPATPAN